MPGNAQLRIQFPDPANALMNAERIKGARTANALAEMRRQEMPNIYRRQEQEAKRAEIQAQRQGKITDSAYEMEKIKTMNNLMRGAIDQPSYDRAVESFIRIYPDEMGALKEDIPRQFNPQWVKQMIAGTTLTLEQQGEPKLYETEEGWQTYEGAIGKKRPRTTKEPTLYLTEEGYQTAAGAIGKKKPTAPGPGERPLTSKEKFDMRLKLSKDFKADHDVDSFVKINTQYDRAKVAIKEAREGTGSMNAVDQSLIQLLNRILDPGSVVRESEYARTPEGMSLMNRAEGYVDRMAEGGAGLNMTERESLYNMIEKFYDVAAGRYNDQVQHYSSIATDAGLDPTKVLRLGGRKAEKSKRTKPRYKPTAKPKTANEYLKKEF